MLVPVTADDNSPAEDTVEPSISPADTVNEAEPDAEPPPTLTSTVELNVHKATSMAYYIHSTDPRFHRPHRMFVGEKCVEQCLDAMQTDADYILHILR
jgi:hypothetical protein